MSPNTSGEQQADRPHDGSVSWFYDPRFRKWAAQAVVLVLLCLGVYELVVNTSANLTRLNQNFGFDFLSRAAGFDLSTSLLPYSSNSSYSRALLVGFWNTALVSIVGVLLASILGFTIGVMRLSQNSVVAAFAGVYIEIVRNIPLLLQIFIWYALVLKPLPGPKQAISLFESIFISNRGIIMPHPSFGSGAWLAVALFIGALVGTWVFRRMARARKEATGRDVPVWLISLAALFLAPVVGLLIAGWPLTWSHPVLAGFNFKGGMTLVPEFVALLLALSTYTAAFIAEIVRSGITSVSRGQTEAASALGLDSGKTLRLIVIPQALRVIIPPLTSQYLNLTKNSSLAVAIGYPDLMYAGGTVNNQSGKAIEVFSILLVVYLSVSILTSIFMNWFNARMKLVER